VATTEEQAVRFLALGSVSLTMLLAIALTSPAY